MLYPLSPVLWLVKEVQAFVIWLQLALLTSPPTCYPHSFSKTLKAATINQTLKSRPLPSGSPAKDTDLKERKEAIDYNVRNGMTLCCRGTLIWIAGLKKVCWTKRFLDQSLKSELRYPVRNVERGQQTGWASDWLTLCLMLILRPSRVLVWSWLSCDVLPWDGEPRRI